MINTGGRIFTSSHPYQMKLGILKNFQGYSKENFRNYSAIFVKGIYD